MAKKGGQAQLIIDIETDEDWETFVERPGLLLADVYSEWCGPCSGMAGHLRKAKLEFGGETLGLATAKADNITCLERFRNKSEPTWMFISNKKVIRLIFGTNAPKLIRILEEEVKKTKLLIESGFPRDGIEFDELTDEEQAKVDEEKAIREEKERLEIEERERAIVEHREAVVTNLLEPLKEFNFILMWPYVLTEKTTQIVNYMKEGIMTMVGKPSKLRLTEEDLVDIFYYSEWQLSELESQELTKEDCSTLLLQAPAPADDEEPMDEIQYLREKIYGTMQCPPGDDDSIAVRLSKTIKVEREIPEEPEVFEHIEDDPEVQRRASGEDPAQDKFIDVAIPAMLVPDNEKFKVMAMRKLFPHVTIKFDIPEQEPIPPHLIVVFDTYKKNDAMQIAEEWPEQTMKYGFFTSADPAQAKLVCKTVAQFNRMMVPMETKLVIKVSKKKSEPLLSYSVLGPVYVSPNTEIGEIQAAQFFPENYDDEEVIIEEAAPPPPPPPPPVKKKKKKKKPPKISDEEAAEGEGEPEPEVPTEEVVEGEGAEGEEGEEGEEEEEDDDDDDEDEEDDEAEGDNDDEPIETE